MGRIWGVNRVTHVFTLDNWVEIGKGTLNLEKGRNVEFGPYFTVLRKYVSKYLFSTYSLPGTGLGLVIPI
jgi:hypothetical protein